ncbi:MAG: aldehyde dehydrogenase family protein [Sphingopyxis sp.]|nr:aldehyde dehydrogenase family protein [Sphingopyxis sp.]
MLLALEMGGHNPLVVHGVKDLDRAAELIVVSAFISAGQRCTCARRLILTESMDVSLLLDLVMKLMRSLRVGVDGEAGEVFMGPVISQQAGRQVLAAQESWRQRGAVPLIEAVPLEGCDALLSPGLWDTTHMRPRDDEEVFGPLLQVIRVRDLAAAINEANCTRYGLAASLLCDDPGLFYIFSQQVRAGVINWNQPTTGASGRLPLAAWAHQAIIAPAVFMRQITALMPWRRPSQRRCAAQACCKDAGRRTPREQRRHY